MHSVSATLAGDRGHYTLKNGGTMVVIDESKDGCYPKYVEEVEEKNNKSLKLDSVDWTNARYMCIRCGSLLLSQCCPRCD